MFVWKQTWRAFLLTITCVSGQFDDKVIEDGVNFAFGFAGLVGNTETPTLTPTPSTMTMRPTVIPSATITPSPTIIVPTSSATPVCTALAAPANGSVSINCIGGICIATFTCDTGFDLIGSAVLVCQPGQNWDGTPPSCERRSCPVPSIPNGDFSGGTYVGDWGYVTCDAGYVLRFGPPWIRCTINGWNRLPACVPDFPFPWGPSYDRCFYESDDDSWSPISLNLKIPIGNHWSKRIYINPNGLICTRRATKCFTPPNPWVRFDRRYRRDNCMAAYYADIDTRFGGRVCAKVYDFTESGSYTDSQFDNLRLYINEVQQGYDPTVIIKVTWDVVPRFKHRNELVTFQLVYFTDGRSAHALVFYKNAGMGFMDGSVYIGLMDEGNLHAVGLYNPAAFRPDLNAEFANRHGAIHFTVRQPRPNDGINYEFSCRIWRRGQLPMVPWYRQSMRWMPTCPCHVMFMWFDPRFWFIFRSGGLNIYSIRTDMRYTPYGQLCAYNRRGQLVAFGNSGSAFVQYNPLFYQESYISEDRRYKDHCCKCGRCDYYYDVRPRVTSCFVLSWFRNTWTFGEPHHTTLDGRIYTFNGHGEYVLVQLASKFTIQCRTERPQRSDGSFTRATVISAIVVRGDNSVLQVELDNDKTGLIVLAGGGNVLDDYSIDFRRMNGPVSLGNDLMLDKTDETLVATFGNDVSLNVTVGNKLLTVSLGIATEFREQTEGLLGNFNGDPDDDFIKRGETVPLPASSTEKELFVFGKSWQTNSAESVFTYSNSTSWQTFNFPDFEPQYLEDFDPANIQAAMVTCKNNTLCTYDLLVTGDEQLALQTLGTYVHLTEVQTLQANEVPRVTVDSGTTFTDNANYLHVLSGQSTAFTVNASDDGDVTYTLVNGASFATLTEDAQDKTKATVAVSLRDPDPQRITVSVTDAHGISGEVDVVIVYCTGCSGQGTCDYTDFRDDPRTTDYFKYATCQCEIYWDGDDCDNDVDGCATTPCSFDRNCTDVPADVHKADPSMLPATCSPCPSGFASEDGVSLKCVDVDECVTLTPCSQVCLNNWGGYKCSCDSGFRLTSDGTTCVDINECDEGTSDCPHLCTNTQGNFTCDCYPGYTYIADNNTCTGSPPAVCTPIDCSNADGCTEIDGVPTCFCVHGYKLEPDNSCNDVDECAQVTCSQKCDNTVGSFSCSCYPGYKLMDDKITCEACELPLFGDNCENRCVVNFGTLRCDIVTGRICKPGFSGESCDDIDECSDDPGICADSEQLCFNTPGDYECLCHSGYQLDNSTKCIDIDECSDADLNTCEQICINTPGSFSCGCTSYYSVDPDDITKCIDIDECEAGTSDCQQICINTPGRFRCECTAGYVLNDDRRTCLDVSELCTKYPNISCSQFCEVEGNIPVCSCQQGYVIGSDKQTCVDIDECSISDQNLCSNKDSCVNTVGGYTCSCEPGFKLANDDRTCADFDENHYGVECANECACGPGVTECNPVTACDENHYGVECANECACGPGATECNPVTGCVCDSGWIGVKCETDKNECDESIFPCTGDKTECINTPGSYKCVCPDGYHRNSSDEDCVDIDECLSASLNSCNQTCTNTIGSYTCSCIEGFLQNGNECNDINECEQQHGCSHICTNNIGSYRCSCKDGFKLDLINDRTNCIPEEECQTNPCNDNAVCTAANGTDSCVCKPGYEFNATSVTDCIDMKECSRTPSPCSQLCVEQEGSFGCLCDQPGYILDNDQATCSECPSGTYGNNCTEKCTCNDGNTQSCDHVSGQCTCKPGWEGILCDSNIDECQTPATNTCPDNSHCVDSIGSFRCVCDVGYMMSAEGTCNACSNFFYGINCASKCVCMETNSESCDTVTGACTCNSGWEGADCTADIDECTSNADICQDSLKTCDNTLGSYVCPCKTGYTINGSSSICIDDDECIKETDNCKQVCTNTPGSFNCSCFDNYAWNGTDCILGAVNCKTFLVANGPCDEGFECSVEGSTPMCMAIKGKDDDSTLPLFLGLGIGTLALVLLTACCIFFVCLRWRKRHRQQYYRNNVHRGSFSGFTPSSIATKLDTRNIQAVGLPRYARMGTIDVASSTSDTSSERGSLDNDYYFPQMRRAYGLDDFSRKYY